MSKQVTETQALLPVCIRNCQALLLCGDPFQLPPVVSYDRAPEVKTGIERSLFQRLMAGGATATLLSTQVRTTRVKITPPPPPPTSYKTHYVMNRSIVAIHALVPCRTECSTILSFKMASLRMIDPLLRRACQP